MPTAAQIANLALRTIGRQSQDALDRATRETMLNGSAGVHIGIDPAAPNGDHAAIAWSDIPGGITRVATTNAVAPNPGLTIEMIQRARELLENNRVPDDVLYGRSPASSAIEAIERHREAMNPSMVEIEFENNHRDRTVRVRTRVRELARDSDVEPDVLRPENFRHIAQEAARDYAVMLENEILRALDRAHEAANRGRYANHGAVAGMARHMDDVILRTMFGKPSTKTGAIECLKDFKHKNIIHNGWTAKVPDTYEAIKEEGDNMAHCVAGSYTNRIEKGQYLAVHITAPEGAKLPKSGSTLGFLRREKTLAFDQLKGKKNDTHHCKHSGLLWFVNMIENAYAGGQLPADAVSV
jgi:PcfJ-like protein